MKWKDKTITLDDEASEIATVFDASKAIYNTQNLKRKSMPFEKAPNPSSVVNSIGGFDGKEATIS